MKAKNLLLSMLLAGACVLAGCGQAEEGGKEDPTPVQPDKVLSSVSVEGLAKTTYIVGQEFDSTGMKVYANYSDGTKTEVASSDYMISGFDSSHAGTNTITITYSGKTATVNLSIIDATVDSISLSGPTKTVYEVGNQLDTTGLVVTAHYSNGTSGEVELSQCQISGFDSSTIGEKEVTVTYKEKSAKFTVSIVEPTLVGITVTPPTKLAYEIGEEFDKTGMVVTADYSNDTHVAVLDGEYTVSGFDSSESGTKLVTVSYQGETDSFVVTIKELRVTAIDVTAPSKVTYWVGEEYDGTGLAVLAHYSDGSSKDIDVEDCEVAGFDSSVAGKVTITVTYEGQSDSFDVDIVAPKLTGITLTAPSKLNYRVNSNLNYEGMVVTGSYEDSKDREIAIEDCEITGFDSSKAGSCTVRVTVEDFYDEFDVVVEEAPAAIDCTMSFDTPEDVSKLTISDSSKAVWDLSYSIDNSHDGVGSLKVTPSAGAKWPQFYFGTDFDLRNIAKVEMYIYAEGETVLNNMALMFKKTGETATQFSKYPSVNPGEWVKYEVSASELKNAIDDLSSVEIYLGNNGSDYINRCVFYVDSFNLIAFPAVTELTASVNKNIRVGAELNKDDISIVATFDDDSTGNVSLSECEIEGFDSSTTGDKEMSITYKGKTISCSYTVEEAPAAISVTHAFDNAEDVASIPGSNAKTCWDVEFTNSISHDGVGSMKIDPNRSSTTKWPKINFGDYDLSNAETVEFWVYFDSDNGFDTFAIFASDGETTKASSTVKVASRTWTKFSLAGSVIASKVTDITDTRIYFAQNGGSYDDRSSIYIDSFNIVNFPVLKTLTAEMNKNIRVGGSLKDNDINITATYDNDSSETVALNSCEIADFDSSTAGTREMSITYKGTTIKCSYTIEEAPAAVSVTNGFDTAEEVAKLPAGASSDVWCWPRALSTEMSHDGVGSLKVTPHKTDGTWPGLDFGAYDLTDAIKVEIWAYVDGDEGLNNIAIRLKAGNTTNVYTSSKNLPAREWFKFEIVMSSVTATPEQLANMNIWVFQNNSTYTNRCPIYFDSLNITKHPPTVAATNTFDTAEDVAKLPDQTADDKYAWSLSYSTEMPHDGAGSLKITPLNRGTTYPALNLGAYDLTNVRKIEFWAYADSDEDLTNMTMRLKVGSAKKYEITHTLVGHEWVKYEVLMSETDIAAEDLKNMNIWLFHNSGTYSNKCVFYVDTLNLIEYPPTVSVTKSFDTADDVTNLPAQTSDDSYAWSLSHSLEQSHDGVGSLKITPLNRGTTWPALNLGAYDLTNVSKIELWAYADSAEDLPGMRLRLKFGSTGLTKKDVTKTLTGGQWVKFEMLISDGDIAAEQINNINIWFYHSAGSYSNKCPIYIDSLNLVEAE